MIGTFTRRCNRVGVTFRLASSNGHGLLHGVKPRSSRSVIGDRAAARRERWSRRGCGPPAWTCAVGRGRQVHSRSRGPPAGRLDHLQIASLSRTDGKARMADIGDRQPGIYWGIDTTTRCCELLASAGTRKCLGQMQVSGAFSCIRARAVRPSRHFHVHPIGNSWNSTRGDCRKSAP